MAELKRTPIYPYYVNNRVKMVDFGGWEMPVQFTSITEEHQAVRTAAGLFDVSHMGEVEIFGNDALAFLQRMMTNDVSKMKDGQVQYNAMCTEAGGVIDDLLIYRYDLNHYFLVLNAGNRHKDLAWLNKHRFGDVTIQDVSEETALLAIQGPKAAELLQKVTNLNVTNIRYFRFEKDANIAGVDAMISRTGYTGEDGFELYCKHNDALSLWHALLEECREDGLIPCGLGARDLLRFEACLPLYGQELTETITPLEANLGFAVKLNKEADFIGKTALLEEKNTGSKRKIVGIEMIERGIPRTGFSVYKDEQEIGKVTSGTQSLTLNKNIGLALLQSEHCTVDTIVEVQVRKKRIKAKVREIPFYKRS